MRDRPVLGWHWFIDYFDCQAMPHSPDQLETIIVEAARMAGATVVQSCFHHFSPHGLSGVVVIAESHLAAHTWPEHGTICVDLFSCSQNIQSQIAIDWMREQFRATSTEVRYVIRGADAYHDAPETVNDSLPHTPLPEE